MLAARPVFLIATVILLAALAGWLAGLPAALTAIAIAGVALAGALLGGPPPGQQAENPAPYLSWANGDFILLDSIVMAALTTGAAALIFGLALTFEALRPDIRDIDDVFS